MNMYLRCLAREEPEIVCLAVRPGIVATEMVRNLYANPRSKAVMDPQQYRFMELQREQGKLLTPEQPAEVMAKLVLSAPQSLSGSFISWDDSQLKELNF